MSDADLVRLVHEIEIGVWELAPVDGAICVTRLDMPQFRSKHFLTVAECHAFIHGYVTAKAMERRDDR